MRDDDRRALRQGPRNGRVPGCTGVLRALSELKSSEGPIMTPVHPGTSANTSTPRVRREHRRCAPYAPDDVDREAMTAKGRDLFTEHAPTEHAPTEETR